MSIRFRCECGREIEVADAAAGKAGKCPGCGAAVVVPPRGPDLADRIAALESRSAGLARRCAVLQWMLATCLLGLVGLASLVAVLRPAPAPATRGAARGGTLEGNALVLKDKAGAVRARLGVDERDDDRPVSLELFAKGKRVARLAATDERDAGLEFYGPTEGAAINPSCWIGVAETGGVALFDKDGRIAARFSENDGAPGLELYGSVVQKQGLEVYAEKDGVKLNLIAPDGTCYTFVRRGHPASEVRHLNR